MRTFLILLCLMVLAVSAFTEPMVYGEAGDRATIIEDVKTVLHIILPIIMAFGFGAILTWQVSLAGGK